MPNATALDTWLSVPKHSMVTVLRTVTLSDRALARRLAGMVACKSPAPVRSVSRSTCPKLITVPPGQAKPQTSAHGAGNEKLPPDIVKKRSGDPAWALVGET